jgi:hypothetical protein
MGSLMRFLLQILHIMMTFFISSWKRKKNPIKWRRRKNRTNLLHRHFLSLLLRFEFQQ